MKKYIAEQIEYMDKIQTMKHGSLQNDLHAYFYIERDAENNIIENSVVTIVAIGVSHPDPNYHIERTGRPHYILEYVLDGVGYVNAHGKMHTVSKGDVYILEPNTVHNYYSDKTNPYSKLWINFRSDIFTSVYEALGLYGVTHFQNTDCEGLFREIIALEKISPYNRDVAHDALELLLSIATRLAKTLDTQRHSVPLNIYNVKRMLDSSIYGNVSVDDICKKLFLSRSYVFKSFKEYYGMTPHKYLLNEKLKIATSLLSGTGSNISEIADTLGFCDEFHFSKKFKDVYGCSPSVYRTERKNHLPGYSGSSKKPAQASEE